jgi:hypothetical protein
VLWREMLSASRKFVRREGEDQHTRVAAKGPWNGTIK